MIGQRFSRLLILEEVERSKWNDRRVRCLCDCGKTKIINYGSIKQGLTKSCGCLQKEVVKKAKTKHGFSARNEEKHPLYALWVGMRKRCNNKKHKNFDRYGGRGIKVCPEWDDFSTFVSDMGERPEGFLIERLDNNKGYSKENCKWASYLEQQNNRSSNLRISFNGEIISEAELARRTNIARTTIQYWRNHGVLHKHVQGVSI